MNTNQAQMPQVNEIEWNQIDGSNTDFETVYPRLQWVHGDPRASQGIMKTGGFFISAEQCPFFKADGFEPQTLITQDGKEINGFGASSAKLAVIRLKTQWITDDKQKNIPLLQCLVYVKGNEDVLCLSLKGASKSLTFQKQFQTHIAQNIATANKTRPANINTLEPFALWFPIKAGELSTITAKDGKSQSKVTYPELIEPKEISRDYVVSLWIGVANYKLFGQTWRDTKKWQNEPIYKQIAPETNEIHQSFDGILDDYQVKQLLDLSMIKSVDEKDFCLSLTNGETDRFEALRKSEFKDALGRLQTL
jgi:hypothetical protein